MRTRDEDGLGCWSLALFVFGAVLLTVGFCAEAQGDDWVWGPGLVLTSPEQKTRIGAAVDFETARPAQRR